MYLDRERGDFLWLYNIDENASEAGISPGDNSALRQRVADFPDRYVRLPGLDHGDHHKILREFLDSDWTDDDDARLKAREAYFGSIGGWKKAVADEGVVYAYYVFRDQAIKNMAEQFLHEKGVEPEWK